VKSLGKNCMSVKDSLGLLKRKEKVGTKSFKGGDIIGKKARQWRGRKGTWGLGNQIKEKEKGRKWGGLFISAVRTTGEVLKQKIEALG